MRKTIAAIAFAFMLSSTARATNGMRMIGFGPVQNSMGGVGVGATLDASSIASNPAGIADLGSRLDVGVGFFKPTVSYTATGTPLPPPFPPSLIASDGATIDSDRGGSPIPAVAYVRPLNEQLSAGLGVFAVSGMGVDYPTNLYLSKSLTSYMNARLAPGVAFKLNDMLSVGATVNVMMAQMEYDVAAATGQAKHSTATSWGAGATVGVEAKLSPMFSVGAAYETKSWFQDFSFNVPGGKDDLTFDQPQVATLGASVRPMEMLLLAADVQWINWADTMGKNLPKYAKNEGGSQAFDMSWKDQWVLKVGAQLTPMKGLDVRAGYDYGAMPLDRSRAFENLVFPAVAEHHFTLGAGYAVADKLTVQVTGMYSPEAKISGSNDGQAIAAYSTTMSQFQIDVGGSYRF
ncbi:MAG TPA: outer membrane protein transport protein [Anaeromyxobacter sp.]